MQEVDIGDIRFTEFVILLYVVTINTKLNFFTSVLGTF